MKLLRFPLSLLVIAMFMAAVLPTTLRITVMDDLGNRVIGATVLLYETEEDYNKNENPVGTSYSTNEKGMVTIKELKAQVYFINVEKGDMNNYSTGVQIGPIESGKKNKATIIIQE
jgi:uncharacterized GH25 family protein